MNVKRRSTTNHFIENEFIDYKIPTHRSGKYCVDDSNFQPISESIKRLAGTRNLSGEEVQMLYDFPNGKDTGIKVPFERSAANVDIAILTQDVKTKQLEMKEEIQEGVDKINRELNRKQKIQSSNPITISTTPTSVAPTGGQ